MADIGSLIVRIGADASALHKEFDKLGNSAKDFDRSLASVGRTLGISLAGMATAAIAATASAAQYAEQLDLVSQKTGIAVEDIQGMTVALARNGLGIDALVIANKKLSQTMIEAQAPTSQAAGMMRDLGITASTTGGMLDQIADVFQHMPDGAGKTALAIELLGKSGQDLIPVLNKGAAGLRESQERAIELGSVLSGPALAALGKADTAFDDLGVATKAAGHQLGAVLAPAVTAAVNAMADGLGVTANFMGVIAGGAQATENIIPLMKAMEKMGLSMEGFKPAELAKELEKQKKFAEETKRVQAEYVEGRRKADEQATASVEKAFLKQVDAAMRANIQFRNMVEEEERLRVLHLELSKPPESGAFVEAVKERATAIENLMRLMPHLDRNEAEQMFIHNSKVAIEANRQATEAYQHRLDVMQNGLTVQDAVMRQQEVMFRTDPALSDKAGAARRVAFEQQRQRIELETRLLDEQFGMREITEAQYLARKHAMEIDADTESRQIIERFPTFWESQLKAIADSNAFSIGAIVNTWTSGIAQVVVKGGDLKAAWEATQVAIIQGALNTGVQLAAQAALAASVELGILTAKEAARLGLREATNAAIVASDATAATATSTIWASAAAFMTGAFATIAAGFTALGATLIGVVTAVGTWVMGVLTAIGTALGFTGFGAPIAGAILAGVVAIGIAIAASQAIKFAQGGIVNGPTTAMIGEAGSPEAVIPLNQRGADFMRKAFGGGEGQTIITKTYLDGRQIAQATTRHVPRAMRMMGAPA